MGSGRRRPRRIARVGALGVAALLVASCHTGLGATSLLLVAPDGTVAFDLRCTHAQQTCTGTALLRVAGVDTDAVPFSVGPGESAPLTAALTPEQYGAVPSTGYVGAEVVIDDATPGDSAIRVAGTVGLRRSGSAFTERIGVKVDGGSTTEVVNVASISGDGRFVAFATAAAMHPADTNRASDVYVRDRLTQSTQWISTDPTGTGPASGYDPGISTDGRYIVFSTSAALVPSDVNGRGDVYRHDRLTGTRILVSSGDGLQTDGSAGYPSVSGDGTRVAFVSHATNLVPGDTNGLEDVFVHDIVSGLTIRASVASDGTEADDDLRSRRPRLSDDGRQVVFDSFAGNLVPGDTNGVPDVFVHDLDTSTTTRVSVASDGTQNTAFVQSPVISGDGRFVAFAGGDLVPGDAGTAYQVYVRDRLEGTTTMVSLALDGSAPRSGGARPSDISPDGRFVVFSSIAFEHVSGDTNTWDVFVRDRTAGVTTRVSVHSDGSQHPHSWAGGTDTISDDGRHVAFYAAGVGQLDPDRPGGAGFFVRDLTG